MRWLAAFLLCVSAQADWIVLRAPGIEVYTDAPQRAARQTIDRLQQIRNLLGTRPGPEPIPLRVVLFGKKAEYISFAPSPTPAGFYHSGKERDYIITSVGVPLDRVVAHEYVHFLSNNRDTVRPAWLEEGLADFYSTFDGKQLGAPIRDHMLRLQQNNWLTAEEINSPRAMNELFYAQSWALVHMLRREPRFPDRVTADMVIQLRQYVREMRPTPVKVPVTALVTPVPKAMSALDALLFRADLALTTGHADMARTLYSQAAREYPNSSSAATGLAVLAAAEGDREKAASELRRALDLNDRDAQALFAAAVLDNDRQALERVVEIDPNFAEAHVLLGVRATDEGDLNAGLRHLEQAVTLMPRKSYAWYSLGYAQWKKGDAVGARRSLQQALQTAASPEQRTMAATLLDSLP